MADAEALALAVEVEVLGGDAEQAGIGVDRDFAGMAAAAELAGAEVDAAGDADADAHRAAAELALGLGLVVPGILEDPNDVFRFHQVEGQAAASDVHPFGQRALHHVAQDAGLDEPGVAAVVVELRLGEVEVLPEFAERVLFLLREQSVLQRLVDGAAPGDGREAAGVGLGEAERVEFLVHLREGDVAVRGVDDQVFGVAADAFGFAPLALGDRPLEVSPGVVVVEFGLGEPVVLLEAAQGGLFRVGDQVVGEELLEDAAPGFGLGGAGAFGEHLQRFEHLVGLGEVHVAAGGGLEHADR